MQSFCEGILNFESCIALVNAVQFDVSWELLMSFMLKVFVVLCITCAVAGVLVWYLFKIQKVTEEWDE